MEARRIIDQPDTITIIDHKTKKQPEPINQFMLKKSTKLCAIALMVATSCRAGQELYRLSFNGSAGEVKAFKLNYHYPKLKDGVVINATSFVGEGGVSSLEFKEELLRSDGFITEACDSNDPEKLVAATCTATTNSESNLRKLSKILPSQWFDLHCEEGLASVLEIQRTTKLRMRSVSFILKSETANLNYYGSCQL